MLNQHVGVRLILVVVVNETFNMIGSNIVHVQVVNVIKFAVRGILRGIRGIRVIQVVFSWGVDVDVGVGVGVGVGMDVGVGVGVGVGMGVNVGLGLGVDVGLGVDTMGWGIADLGVRLTLTTHRVRCIVRGLGVHAWGVRALGVRAWGVGLGGLGMRLAVVLVGFVVHVWK